MRRLTILLAVAAAIAALAMIGCEDKSSDPQEPTWQSLADAPEGVYWGGSMCWDGLNTIYALRGSSDDRDEFDRAFWEYDITSDTWERLADAIADPYWSSSLAHTGDYIYHLQGNGTNNMFAYSPLFDGWEYETDTPETGVRWAGNSLVYPNEGDYVYAVRGFDTDDFWRYDFTSGEWDTLASVPGPIGHGSSITWGGSDWIFATATDTTFWVYDISEETWTEKAQSPDEFADGGWLAYDGANSIFATVGGGRPDFWHYDIVTDEWTRLEDAPDGFDEGGAIVSDGDGVYARPGGGSSEFWVYR
jgi:hypothetical protein